MSLNVLVVDDSGVARAMIIKTLRLTGLPLGEVYQAANGQDGLAVLEENWVDVAFIDINMPVMNGEEMIQQIRSKPTWQDLPIVVVSTEGSQTRIERLQQQNAQFVHKPFSPECVKQLVEQLTGMQNGQPI